MKNVFSPDVNHKLRQRIVSINYLPLRRYRIGITLYSNVPAGAYSVYFRKGSIGIKVVHGGLSTTRVGGSESITTLRRSRVWKEAIKEYKILKQVQPSGITPIPFCVKPVRVGNVYFPAIFMEHIRGKSLCEFKYQAFTQPQRQTIKKLLEKCKKRLLKYGIINKDIGDSNIIVTAHDGDVMLAFKIIEFTPEWTRLCKRRHK